MSPALLKNRDKARQMQRTSKPASILERTFEPKEERLLIANSVDYAETFNEQHPSWGYSKFILLNSVKNYLEDDRLHICVKIREKIRWKIKYSSCHPEQVPFYVNNPSYTLMIPDITVHVSSEDTDSSNINEKTNTITIPAHKEILAASSVYLKTLIIVLEPFNRDKLFIRGVDPGLFVRVLRHCYIADAEIVDIKDAIKLADIAYRFQLNNLMIDALYYLRMRVNVDNIWDIWYISAFVRHNCRSVLESSSWVHADKKLVLETLKIDKLPEAVDEVIFFQAVLAWRTTAITKFCHEFIDSSNEYSGQLKKDFTEYILNDSKEELEYSEKIEEKDSETNEYSNIEKTFGTTNTERLRDIEISFSEMLHCIRFSRMELVFISDIVENIDSVMNVEGIEELLSNAYRCLAFKGKKYVPEESRQLHIN
ncbi:hypothetical protein PHYBLDRAFT_71105 [Phycomyces blakesleeanus NRRL 1555(-)]|uniref:BTB domain-containing protein n=1 Tax=Phycomyces blakesleeanus (strain ATCC 8743b / DSM 1359 / FGSC 10004 / NBRC 33097 / NRRL 1555) TaxID=763407 RepID=A0A167JMK6_PHYB8|nr:hypothetical protein PHYBLDRAFT_71105 [Phycomyces blakesleeanus NRRL 1555(-)]OAD66309.1 hypothetical protein PHYBLDRAFT_71105 [Phycomyces blakesleeanus NRRL 1555(-)]|eukprot:XP_018284349.1 hypothetical protein PHYBLDRAFT_71105 [Phycomyces blakesleeanus NRRL 1555(-)]